MKRLPLKDKRLPLYYNVYQPNRCLTRDQDFSILGTGIDAAVRLPLKSNTKWMSRVYFCKTAFTFKGKAFTFVLQRLPT